MLNLPEIIALIGLMGSVKSSIGRLLAPALHYVWVDLDEYIEQKENRSIAAIFAKEGRMHFRQLENDALRFFSQQKGILISTGGGAPTTPQNRALLEEYYFTIHLKVAPEVAAKRLFHERANRPLIAHCTKSSEVESSMQHIWDQRKDFYAMANSTIDVSYLSREEVAIAIIERLKEQFA